MHHGGLTQTSRKALSDMTCACFVWIENLVAWTTFSCLPAAFAGATRKISSRVKARVKGRTRGSVPAAAPRPPDPTRPRCCYSCHRRPPAAASLLCSGALPPLTTTVRGWQKSRVGGSRLKWFGNPMWSVPATSFPTQRASSTGSVVDYEDVQHGHVAAHLPQRVAARYPGEARCWRRRRVRQVACTPSVDMKVTTWLDCAEHLADLFTRSGLVAHDGATH